MAHSDSSKPDEELTPDLHPVDRDPSWQMEPNLEKKEED